MTNRLDQRLAQFARQRPQAIALEWSADGGSRPGTATYAQLEVLVDRVAGRLNQRFPAGAVVMLRWPNSLAYVASFLAILRAGLKVFPVSPQLGLEELRAAAGRGGAAALIGQPQHRSALDGLALDLLDADLLMSGSAPMPVPMPKPAPADPEPGLLLQSSGTTGTPKIVFRDRPSLDAVAENVCVSAGLNGQDRVLGVAQLSHSFGMENAMLGPLWAGGTIHLLRSAEAGAWPEALAGRKITVLPVVPFLFELLVGAVTPLKKASDLRLAYSAGAPLPADVSVDFAKRFGMRIGQLYGATEVGSVTFNHPADGDFQPGSVGKPMAGVSILILDSEKPDPAQPLPPDREGHVAVRAPSMFRGYFDAPTTEMIAGHFLTGDLGRLDAAGRLTLTGRLKLLIDVGGMKINPQEVEQVLMEHPQVRECAVLALPVTRTVERLKAVVVLRQPRAPFSAEDLRLFASRKLSAYKVPRVVEVLAELPRSPSGKILREKLQ